MGPYDESLVRRLVALPHETQWLEFKHNKADHEEIGQYISALGNSATCEDKEEAYLIYGVDDSTHEIVGTSFDPSSYKVSNEELENWLRKLLSDNANFEFVKRDVDGKSVVIVAIQRALSCPIVFKKVGYIRCGSYKKKLCDVPALEKKLWGKLLDPAATFEKLHAAENLDLPSVLMRLDAAYFERTGIQQPFDTSNIAHYLEEDGIIKPQDNGQYSITNLGALLFAQKLSDYPQLSRKCLRIIQYNGNSKTSIKNDTIFDKGYASSFDEMIRYIVGLLPAEEEIVDGIHKINSRYPEIVVRELLANALVHQDFTLTGAGPTLEIFDDWFEVTNPGKLLVDEMRIIDNPPRSRNESLAMLMRRCHICEEAGSGWDKVVAAAEKVSLPAPRILEYSGTGYSSTKVVVHSFVSLDKLSNEDKIWSCYLHACLRHTIDEMLTNTSLRERFGVPPKCSPSISRIIKASLEKHLIKPFEKTARRYMKYIPFWA